MFKKEIVLIPSWIQEVLHRNKLNIQECLSLDTLKKVMSVEDLAQFAAAQAFIKDLTGVNEIDEYGLSVAWSRNSNAQSNAFLQSVINPMKIDPNTVEGVRNRLFNPEFKQIGCEIPFITYDLSPTALGVVVYPGFFTSTPSRNLRFALVEGILKAFYECGIPAHEVNRTPLCRTYLKLLGERQFNPAL